MSKSDLILDADALAKMGLHSEAIWAIEYDLPNIHVSDLKKRLKEGKITKTQFKETMKKVKFLRHMRNKLMFQLKFKLMATKNLDSNWFIPNENLELANKLLTSLRNEFVKHGYPYMANRIRIIPILTNEEGFESFMDRKAEFLLEFLSEAQKQVDKGLKEGLMSDSILWRCKKASEIVECLKDSLKNHSRYNEIVDTLTMLDDSIAQFEAKREQAKMKEA